MLIDTHCHLQLGNYPDGIDSVIKAAHNVSVNTIIVPGTNVKTSQDAVSLSEKYEGVYAAVGIHPEDIQLNSKVEFKSTNPQIHKINGNEIEKLLNNKKVVAVGEVGLDKFEIRNTKYELRNRDEVFEAQKQILIEQIELAVKYKKALILHSRETASDIVTLLQQHWDQFLSHKTVFHCCEANEELLAFAKEKNIYIGVDGDISWSKKKQRFISEVPLDLLVLETDSPYLIPLELKNVEAQNSPKNTAVVCNYVAQIKGMSAEQVANATTENARELFGV